MPVLENPLDPSRMFEFFPIKVANAVKKTKGLSYNGVVKVPGISTQCHEIELTAKNKGEIKTLHFNVNTSLLESVSFFEEDLTYILSKYKEFDGYMIPTFVAYLNKEGMFSWKEFTVIKINPSIPDREFDPEKGKGTR